MNNEEHIRCKLQNSDKFKPKSARHYCPRSLQAVRQSMKKCCLDFLSFVLTDFHVSFEMTIEAIYKSRYQSPNFGI
jgi:hypothetical protein